MTFDIDAVRAQFPALQTGTVYLDNPGGTQVPQRVLDRMTDYLVRCNANKGGGFRTSSESDAIIAAAHAALADFLNCDPREVVFGANMTTLTLHISRSLAKWLKPGDEIVVTRLDHDANVAPWLLAAQDAGAVVRWVDVNLADATLKIDDVTQAITPKTRIVAVGYASNAVGTINPVKHVIDLAHAVGALVYVDAVQYAPHGLVDVRALDCDFLVCSAYKFFGPHVGVLYGKHDLLDRLPAYKVRPAHDEPPDKFETGTLNHEGIAGTLGAIEYLEWVGDPARGYRPLAQVSGERDPERRARLARGLAALETYEHGLARALIAGLQAIPGVRIYGITDPERVSERVATVSFTLAGQHPRRVAEQLGEHDINVWDGNYYAYEIVRRLGLDEGGGMVRVGPVHYNTQDEIAALVAAVRALAT
ncbi:MAG: cysteine desulfurase-like protein [Anaerolineales bacterium]|nr:cysteine desulfurase-like protein [Anaerolineales bacterium]